jgi:hypothetical protein
MKIKKTVPLVTFVAITIGNSYKCNLSNASVIEQLCYDTYTLCAFLYHLVSYHDFLLISVLWYQYDTMMIPAASRQLYYFMLVKNR